MKLKELFFKSQNPLEFFGHDSTSAIDSYNKSPLDFKVGEVYKMAVAKRSHVKKPYYVIIKNVSEESIETDIPNGHSLVILHNSYEWGYHIPRMTFMGDDEESKKLILNQDNIITFKQ